MHMSEAGILGEALKLSRPSTFMDKFSNREETTRYCGCFLGGALMATSDQNTWDAIADMNVVEFATALQEKFPWFNWHQYEDKISSWYYQVCDKTMTVEQLADEIRKIEPECGECNQYACTCLLTQQTQSEPASERHVPTLPRTNRQA